MNWPERLLNPGQPQQGEANRLSLLGHDLRAAVSDIIGGLRLVNHDGLDRATSLQLERVRAAGEVLAQLLEETFAALDGEPRAAAPANVEMLRFLYDVEMRWSGRAHEKGLDFRIAVAPDIPRVLTVDRIALERALANVLSNAIRHTDSGTVRLGVSLTDTGSIRMAVRDEGPGLSDAALARLWDDAARPEGMGSSGHGLGLHILKDMARRLRGTVTAGNLPGGGAEVVIDLPRESWSVAAPEPQRPLPDLGGIKVLVAEDTPTNQAHLEQMLTAMGAGVVIAEDGVEALARLNRDDFDLALIDIELPRLSGTDVIRALRSAGSRHRYMPVIAATSHVLHVNHDAALAAGADAILAKPLPSIDVFGPAIADVLARGACGPALIEASPAAGRELDRARFDHLIDIAGPATGREILDRVASDLRRAEHGLRSGLAERDLAAIRAHTHVLISVSGALGAERLLGLAQSLNAAAHRGEEFPVARLGPETLTSLERMIRFVDEEKARRGEGP